MILQEQELRFLFSTRCLMLLNNCTKFHENILGGIKIIEQTRFSLKIFQRGIISQKLLVELQFLFSAHTSDTSLYLYPVSRKYL